MLELMLKFELSDFTHPAIRYFVSAVSSKVKDNRRSNVPTLRHN